MGSGVGRRNFYYMNIGSGIGGAMIINGHLFDGQGVGAAETGQTRIPDWTSKEIGADTRLEALCSGWAIESRLQKDGYVPENSALMQLCAGDISKLNCKKLGQAVKMDDSFAKDELDRIAASLGTALAGVLCLLQPERIAVGGGVSLIGEELFTRLGREIAKRCFISNVDRYDVVQCELGEEIVLNGAILLAASEQENKSAIL